ncbi:MAG: LPXTG cell wall anchor domain-containing protein, partial [Clostridia bacterium]|nr:LPXTG cell wall anchor domain-containing protein [Clostridia bacterium]
SFGINITKHFSDKTDKEAYESGLYDKVEFKVYNETDKVWLVAENIDGIYYVKGYTTDESKATSFVPVNFSEEELGKLCVYGVEDDVYQIVEVNTAEGYTLLEENVELSIVFENENASAFVAGKEVEMNAKNESADATVSLNIVNNKVPDLPITGDTGMFMFVAIGVVLMTGAVIAIKKISRKNKD